MLNTISHRHNRELTKPLSFLGNLPEDTLLILVVTVNQAAITELNTPPNFVENVGGDEVVLKRKRLHSAVTRWFLVAKSDLFPMNLDYAEIIAKIVIVSGMIILMLHLTKLLCKLLSNIESYYFPL